MLEPLVRPGGVFARREALQIELGGTLDAINGLAVIEEGQTKGTD